MNRFEDEVGDSLDGCFCSAVNSYSSANDASWHVEFDCAAVREIRRWPASRKRATN